jgi:hypothetical protein
MFNSQSQDLHLKQQVISASQSYPCPRCSDGVLEPYGHTETLACNSCSRSFVPLRGGRLLFPSKQLGYRIAPTFWWDGFRWHWAGTTASSRQLAIIVLSSLIPVLALNVAITLNLWENRPIWCNPIVLSPLVALLSIQLIYFMCWDFAIINKKTVKHPDSQSTHNV